MAEAGQNESEPCMGMYGKPQRDMVGYGAQTPDPVWPNNVSIFV